MRLPPMLCRQGVRSAMIRARRMLALRDVQEHWPGWRLACVDYGAPRGDPQLSRQLLATRIDCHLEKGGQSERWAAPGSVGPRPRTAAHASN